MIRELKWVLVAAILAGPVAAEPPAPSPPAPALSAGKNDPVEAGMVHARRLVGILRKHKAGTCGKIVSSMEGYVRRNRKELDRIVKAVQAHLASLAPAKKRAYANRAAKKITDLLAACSDDFMTVVGNCPNEADRIAETLKFTEWGNEPGPHPHAHGPGDLVPHRMALPAAGGVEIPTHMKELIGHRVAINKAVADNLPDCGKVLRAIKAYADANGAGIRKLLAAYRQDMDDRSREERQELLDRIAQETKELAEETQRVHGAFFSQCPGERMKINEILRRLEAN
jgi:hypothetical protein